MYDDDIFITMYDVIFKESFDVFIFS